MRSSSAAVAPAPRPEVIPVPEAGVYFVSSASVPGAWRRVDARTRTCSCPAGRNHERGGTPCRHLSACYEHAGRQAAAVVLPAPAAPDTLSRPWSGTTTCRSPFHRIEGPRCPCRATTPVRHDDEQCCECGRDDEPLYFRSEGDWLCERCLEASEVAREEARA